MLADFFYLKFPGPESFFQALCLDADSFITTEKGACSFDRHLLDTEFLSTHRILSTTRLCCPADFFDMSGLPSDLSLPTGVIESGVLPTSSHLIAGILARDGG